MKNIIPFKKDVIFKTKISEITSISLEHTLNLQKDKVVGEFIVSGDYKVTDNSTSTLPFELKLPFEIVIDERYKTDKATIDIDDFYYEIVNDSILNISIDVLIDKLEEQPLIEFEDLTDLTPVRDMIEEEEEMEDLFLREEKEETVEKVEEVKEEELNEDIRESASEKINSLFSQFSKDSEAYVSYSVFIVREGDSVESILEKYNISIDDLKKYNDLSNLQIGDKLIIPNIDERD